MPQKVVVVGGAGFLGFNLVKALSKMDNKYTVVSFDIKKSQSA